MRVFILYSMSNGYWHRKLHILTWLKRKLVVFLQQCTLLWASQKRCQAALQASLLGLLTQSSCWLWSQLAVTSSTEIGDTSEMLFSKLGFIFPVLNRKIKHRIAKNHIVNDFPSFNYVSIKKAKLWWLCIMNCLLIFQKSQTECFVLSLSCTSVFLKVFFLLCDINIIKGMSHKAEVFA